MPRPKPRLRSLASSRLTSKSQATVPLPIRRRLGLGPGDSILFEERRDGVIAVRKAETLDLAYLAALESTLSEWNSENDERAYAGL